MRLINKIHIPRARNGPAINTTRAFAAINKPWGEQLTVIHTPATRGCVKHTTYKNKSETVSRRQA